MVWSEEVATLRCTCGHAILCEMQRLGTLTFFDAGPTSETHGERVESCPGCGEQLEFLTLVLKNLRS
jgi:hypothetical protein